MQVTSDSQEKPREAIGINSEVRAGKRSFHLQTSFEPEKEQIITSLFEGGKLIEKTVMSADAAHDMSEIKKDVESCHYQIARDIELLFSMSEKVKAVQHPLSHNRMGLLFFKYNFLEDAKEQFSLAIDKESENPEYYLNLGDVYCAQQIYSKAVEQYTIGLDKGPNYADLHNRLGIVLSKQGKYLDAIEQFREALRVNNKYHHAYFNLGLILLESTERDLRDSRLPPPSERLSEAAKRFRKAMQLSQSYDRENMKQGLRYIEERQPGKALREFTLVREEHIRTTAHDYEHEFFLRFLFGAQKEEFSLLDEFIAQLRGRIEEHPAYADLRNNLGIAYLIQGRNFLFKALEEFRQALEINPKFKKADKNLRLVENDGRGFLILLRALLK